jgi:hypothetical protein
MCLPAFLLDLPSRISLFLPGFPRSFSDLSVSPMDLSVSTLHAPSPCISFLCLLWISYPKSLCISFVSPMCLPVFPLDLQFRTSLPSICHPITFPYLPAFLRISLYFPLIFMYLPWTPYLGSPCISLSLLFLYLPSRIYLWLPGSSHISHGSLRIYPRLLIPNLPVFFMHLSVSFLHSSSQISLSLH